MTIAGFSHGCQIDPSIVIKVECCDSPGSQPMNRKMDLIYALAPLVSPQRNTGSSIVRQGQIHPPVFVEVKNTSGHNRRQDGLGRFRPEFECLPFSFPWIEKYLRLAGRKQHVDGAVIVEVRSRDSIGTGMVSKSG